MSDIIESVIQKSYLDMGYIFIWGYIDESMARHVVERLRYLHFIKNVSPIHIYIHTEGGDVHAAYSIIDEINGLKSVDASIYTIALGKAYSSGADILAVGTERYATEMTAMMLHPVSFESESAGISSQVRYTDFMRRQSDMFSKMIANSCGYKTKKQVEKFCELIKDDLWLIGKEAIKFGLIDDLWNYKWEKTNEGE